MILANEEALIRPYQYYVTVCLSVPPSKQFCEAPVVTVQWFVCLSVAMTTSQGYGYGTQSIVVGNGSYIGTLHYPPLFTFQRLRFLGPMIPGTFPCDIMVQINHTSALSAEPVTTTLIRTVTGFLNLTWRRKRVKTISTQHRIILTRKHTCGLEATIDQ